MANLVGKSIGRYHVLIQLGQGGMATVYKAYDTRLERDVAIKIIRRGAFPAESLNRVLKRFEREAKALAKLSHPNIVKVHDYGEYDGSPYLVLEYLPSGTLKQRMGKPAPWQDAVRLLTPIASALEYAHKHDIIHRDIKPSNILIAENGQPMLSDFGVAKLLDNEETMELTGTGVGVGTPEYMAPEQVTSRSVDARADIYALGVVFYEMVTGRKPFTADTPMAVLFKHASEPLPRPKQFVPNLPDGVEKILLKALAKNPADRYEGMGDIRAELEKLLIGEVTDKRSEGSKGKKTSTFAPMDEIKAQALNTHSSASNEKMAREIQIHASVEAKPLTQEPHRKLLTPVIVASIGVLIIILSIGAIIAMQLFRPTQLPTSVTSAPNTLETAIFISPTLTAAVTPTFTASPLPSTPEFPVPITLSIVNKSTTRLTIYHGGVVTKDLWPSGDWIQYGQKNGVEVGTSIDISTYFGDIWAISNNTGAIARYIIPFYYVNEAPHQTVTITSDEITIAAKSPGFGLYSFKNTIPIAAVNFVNLSSLALELHYISSKGIDQKLYTIPAGTPQKIADVKFGDFFYICEPSGTKILGYVATELTEQTVTISDAAVAYHLGVNP